MRRLVLGSLIALVLLTAGCGGDDPGTGSSTSPSADATSSSPTPSASTSTSPPATSQSTVAAATGTELSGTLVSVRAPADFTGKPLRNDYGGNVNGPDAAFNLLLDDDETIAFHDDVDHLAKFSQKASFYDPPLVRQPDLTIAGLPAYHLRGPTDSFGGWIEEFGFRTQGHTVKMLLGTPADLPQAERDAMNAAVLASVTLKS